MHRPHLFAAVLAATFAVASLNAIDAAAQQPGGGYAQPMAAAPAYGQSWGSSAANTDWNRFYHYPYVYYPQNFWGQDYYKSSDSLYHRYPTEMRIPVYNKKWHNYYPSNRRFHMGHHFILDTF